MAITNRTVHSLEFYFTHLWQRSSGTGALGCHGKHGGDAQPHTSRSCIHVDPEGNPGQNDNQQTGDVHLNQVVAHLSLQMESSFDAGELS